MIAADFRSQLEQDLLWRTDEINFFQNCCSNLSSISDQDRFRRASILLIYSHLEGYFKFAMTLYVEAINQENICCEDATHAIAAASMHNVFVSLRTGEKKAPEFRNDAPDDTSLHRFFRDREFVENYREICNRIVNIPDTAIHTESNLKPVVIRKNLYRVGLPHNLFETLEADVNMILELRNKIAHGVSQQGIAQALYEKLKTSCLKIMREITAELSNAFINEQFVTENLRVRKTA